MSDPLILGTAGHIDHGKTALVKALTGIDCDRLPEEQARGITIELGFAPLDLPSGRRLGVVDVPGHEKLVRTMVAGATGIDLMLFVVAADEGIMPQSREHLAISELLGVERGVVALTKADAVSPELLELAQLEVEEELSGSNLAGAPIVPVSALNGDGLDALRAALDEVASSTSPRSVEEGPAWLAVDRSFTMRGFGTVVTGTLRGGPLEAGQMVEILPDVPGARLETKIRGVQVHGESTERALPGSRCALNLPGIEVSALPRGSVVAAPGRLDYRPRLAVELRLLPGAPPLRSGSTLTVHIGTSERSTRVLLLESAQLAAGEAGLAELRLTQPMVAVEGDRFILRGFSRIPKGGWTVGGGRILDAAPLRSRRSRSERIVELRVLAAQDRRAALGARLERAGVAGLREADLRREVRSLDELPGIHVGRQLWLGRQALADLTRRCVEAVAGHHGAQPAEPWVGLAAVASRLPKRVAREAVRAALEAAVAEGRLESGPSGVRIPGHAAHVADPRLATQIEARLVSAGLAPPTLDALAGELRAEPHGLRAVADHLAREGKLVRVAAGLYFARKEVEALRGRVVAYLREHGKIDPATYKQLTGQTRKYTVPLMEYFDAEKLTRRQGNVRVLRAGTS